MVNSRPSVEGAFIFRPPLFRSSTLMAAGLPKATVVRSAMMANRGAPLGIAATGGRRCAKAP
jgi:hypothetical protein